MAKFTHILHTIPTIHRIHKIHTFSLVSFVISDHFAQFCTFFTQNPLFFTENLHRISLLGHCVKFYATPHAIYRKRRGMTRKRVIDQIMTAALNCK